MNTADIQQFAEHLAATYNPDKEAPFPYANILRDHADLSIYYLDMQDESTSGAILYKSGAFRILVNNVKHENRQHFTLGHELGHYFLHKDILRKESGLVDGDGYLDSSRMLYRLDQNDRDTIEVEANHFAACLLMPSELVLRAWEANSDVEAIAQIFKVSTVAMSIRLTELGLVS